MVPARPCRLIAALDTADAALARKWAGDLAPHCAALKLGLEYFMAHGPAGLAPFADTPIFLDLKLHDIPNTVAGAVRSLASTRCAMLTVHAGGGAAMVARAREALGDAPARPLLLAVTVLTSLAASDLPGVGVAGAVGDQVSRLAWLAVDAGADGIVCSPHELARLRRELPAATVLVAPGIRPAGCDAGDQSRYMGPADARRLGADYIVVGRPITQAADPAAMAARIAAGLAAPPA